MKKILCTILSAALISVSAVPAFAAETSDKSETAVTLKEGTYAPNQVVVKFKDSAIDTDTVPKKGEVEAVGADFGELADASSSKQEALGAADEEAELNKATARNGVITNLFSKTYEDNVSGKLSDEMFMELSHKYEVERLELKTKIFEYKERLAKISEMEQNKDDFLKAVRKFMEMETLTAPMLRELIDHIDVYEKEGGKKNYTQRIVIYYRFIGFLELPETDGDNYKANTRKGVVKRYLKYLKYSLNLPCVVRQLPLR